MPSANWVAVDLGGDELFGGGLSRGAHRVEARYFTIGEVMVGGITTPVVAVGDHQRRQGVRWNFDQQHATRLPVGFRRGLNPMADDVERGIASCAGDLVDRLGEAVERYRVHGQSLAWLVLPDADEQCAGVVSEGSKLFREALPGSLGGTYLSLDVEPVPLSECAVGDGGLDVLDCPGVATGRVFDLDTWASRHLGL